MEIKPTIDPDYHKCFLKYGINWTPEFIKVLKKLLAEVYK